MEADSGLDDTLVSYMLGRLDESLLACDCEDCKGLRVFTLYTFLALACHCMCCTPNLLAVAVLLPLAHELQAKLSSPCGQ